MSTPEFNKGPLGHLVPGVILTFSGRRAYKVLAVSPPAEGWIAVHLQAIPGFGMYGPGDEPKYIEWLRTTGWDPLYDEVLSDVYIMELEDEAPFHVSCRNPSALDNLSFVLELRYDSAASNS